MVSRSITFDNRKTPVTQNEAEKIVADYEALRERAISILNGSEGPPWGYVSYGEWARLSFDGDEAVVSYQDLIFYYDDARVDADEVRFPAALLFMSEAELATWKTNARAAYDREQAELAAKRQAEVQERELNLLAQLKAKYGIKD